LLDVEPVNGVAGREKAAAENQTERA